MKKLKDIVPTVHTSVDGVLVNFPAHAISIENPENQVNDDLESPIDTEPTIPTDCFPASLKSAVDAACYKTEANPMAVALHYLIFFASHVGETRHIMIGNERHYLDAYGILVGVTGEVKGTAESQVRCIFEEAERKLIKEIGYKPTRKVSGLSSGEGIVNLLRDVNEEEGREGEIEEGFTDKRICVVESEYANVLKQDQRQGNTLSVITRDAFDCKTLSNLTVKSRVASKPHMSIIGHITPKELVTNESFVGQSSNGTLNRNLIFYARRYHLYAIPRQYSKEEFIDLSSWISDAIKYSRSGMPEDDYRTTDSLPLTMSTEALELINKNYYILEKEKINLPESLASLISRHRVFVWRLSGLFALMDLRDVISVDHVSYAYKWLEYSKDSLRYLLSTAKNEHEESKNADLATKILEFIKSKGDPVTRTDIVKHLSGNVEKNFIDKAIGKLLKAVPPKINQDKIKPPSGKGRPKIIYYYIDEKNEKTK
ncbi:hypothetical protein AB832_05025 [Flavobacteriaceae bacterium (ex Bugula neritina AB1)]|nr:hypothetical protein AB832_05025 [Flavobacteriaceae bacterium (ex Bugula neritina AB1)]